MEQGEFLLQFTHKLKEVKEGKLSFAEAEQQIADMVAQYNAELKHQQN